MLTATAFVHLPKLRDHRDDGFKSQISLKGYVQAIHVWCYLLIMASLAVDRSAMVGIADTTSS